MYLSLSVSAGHHQSSGDRGWKPDADAEPQQHDSPRRRHAWKAEEPLPQHSGAQVWREFLACGERVFSQMPQSAHSLRAAAEEGGGTVCGSCVLRLRNGSAWLPVNVFVYTGWKVNLRPVPTCPSPRSCQGVDLCDVSFFSSVNTSPLHTERGLLDHRKICKPPINSN